MERKSSVTGKTGGEKLRKKQNEREVSSFRFTAVVGEIWLCSYSTLRTEPEEEQRQIYMVRTALAALTSTHWTRTGLQ